MAAPVVTSTQAIEAGHEVGPYVLTREIGKGSFAVVYQGKIRPPISTLQAEQEQEDENSVAGSSSERSPVESLVTRVAIKIVTRKKLTQKLLDNLEGEISILRTVRHANIVELLDCLKAPNYIYLVMQYCRMGDLSIFIRTRKRANSTGGEQKERLERSIDPFEQAMDKQYPHPHDGGLHADVTRSFLAQLASALQFMRAKNIVHRDIKPQNLLLQEPEANLIAVGHPAFIPQLKVADFGFARHLEAASLAETLCGSPLYMAPEILRYEKYDAKADLWSVGAVLFEMCVGKPPFRASNHVELLRRIERGEDKFKFPDERSEESLRRDHAKRMEEGKEKAPFQRPHTVDEDIKRLIRNLLKRRPIERMTFEDFFMCDVLQDYKQRTSASLTGSVGGSSALPSPSPSPSGSSIVARRVAPAVPSDISPRPPPVVLSQTDSSKATNDTTPGPASSPLTPLRQYFAPKYVVGGSKSTLTQPSATRKSDRGASTPETSEPPLAPPLAKPSRITRPNPIETTECEASSLEDNVLETPGSSLSHLPATATPDGTDIAVTKRLSATSTGSTRDRKPDDDRGYVLVDKRNVDAQAVAEESNARQRTGGWSPLGVVRRPSQLGRLASLGGTMSPLAGIAAAASAAMQQPTISQPLISPRTASPMAVATAIPSRQTPAPLTPPIAKSQSPLNPRFSSTPPNAPFVVPASARKPSFSRRTSNQLDSGRPGFARPSLSPLSPSSALPAMPSQSAPSGGVPISPSSHTALIAQPSSSLSRTGSSSSQTVPSSALARAISMASIRLFGVPTGMSMRGADVRRSLRMGLGTGALLSSSPSQGLDVQQYSSTDVAEQNLLSLLHEYGQKSFVLSEFADARLAAFFAEGPHQSSFLDRRQGSNSSIHSTTAAVSNSSRKSSLTGATAISAATTAGSGHSPQQVEVAASEAYVLYVRSLSFLQRAMDAAREYVEARSDSASRYSSGFGRDREAGTAWTGPATGANVACSALSTTSQDVDDAVHWLRAKFNDGVERAKFARSRSCEDLPESAQYIDKMIFDEALEVARRAALEELENNQMGDQSWNAERCLLAYETACTMLQGLLDPAEPNKDLSASALGTIEKFISSISKRMASIQMKFSGLAYAGGNATTLTATVAASPPSIIAI